MTYPARPKIDQNVNSCICEPCYINWRPLPVWSDLFVRDFVRCGLVEGKKPTNVWVSVWVCAYLQVKLAVGKHRLMYLGTW